MTMRTFQLLYPKQVDDYRKVTKKMLDQIVDNNSNDERYPVAVGHLRAAGWEDHHEAAGKFTNLRIQDDILIGDVELQPEIDKAYSQGKYPGWSVGIFKTKKDGWKMDHLALLGSTGAAFKDLKEIDNATFSLSQESQFGVTVETFGEESKTLWLLQSTPRGPVKVEKPAVTKEPLNGGPEEMDFKELNEKFEAQQAQFAELIAQNEKLTSDNEQLKADSKKQAELEHTRKVAEFSNVKETLLTAVKNKGVAKPIRENLSEVLNGFDDKFAEGTVTRELFDAMAKIVDELKPKVEPGAIVDDEDKDEFVEKTKFSGEEAVNAVMPY